MIAINLEQEVSTTQAGYIQNRCTRDHLFNLINLIHKHNEMTLEYNALLITQMDLTVTVTIICGKNPKRHELLPRTTISIP